MSSTGKWIPLHTLYSEELLRAHAGIWLSLSSQKLWAAVEAGMGKILSCFAFSTLPCYFCLKFMYYFYNKNFSSVQILVYYGVDCFLVGISSRKTENAEMCGSAVQCLVSKAHWLPHASALIGSVLVTMMLLPTPDAPP